MKALIIKWLRSLLRAPLFSFEGFMARAIGIAVLFSLWHFLGLREYTSFFSGTNAFPSVGWLTTVCLGLIYTLAYLSFILIAPILVIAAVLLKLLQLAIGIAKKKANHEPLAT